MNNYTEENDTFEFGIKENNNDSITEVNENNYENSDLFNTEVYANTLNNSVALDNEQSLESNESLKNQDSNNIADAALYSNNGLDQFDVNVFDAGFENEDTNANPFTTLDSKNIVEETRQEILSNGDATSELSDNPDLEQIESKLEFEETTSNEIEEDSKDEPVEVESLEDQNNSFDKKTEELSKEINSSEQKIKMSEEDLSSLTTFEEDKVETTDIKSLFDKVGINVKEASDVFKRNTEMKEKLDSRFEELKRLQLEVARKKDEQYAEINSYKEEVLNKLTQKKEEIERRLNKLKEYQASLEKEKEEFEQYRKKEKEEIERVQREVQDAYDSRREELNHVEDVLRRQKDLLDEERSQLSLDKIQYESDKNELANNLLKFNEIVDSFTNGIGKLDKE